MKSLFAAVTLIAGLCCAQNLQAPATPDEMKYLRFLLLNVASLDNSPAAVQSYEDHLVKLHGLNTQESAVVHAAGQMLRPLLAELRQSARSISAANRPLLGADVAALNDIEARRDRKVADLAFQILNSVRPETAARLKRPGQIVAAAHGKSQGKK